jgi:hypothetical protein
MFLVMLIASALTGVLPLVGVVIGGLLAIGGQFVLARNADRHRLRTAARLFHIELAGLLLVLDAEKTSVVTKMSQTRYADLVTTWREHRDVLSTMDETAWASIWLTMLTLNTLFGMEKSTGVMAYRETAVNVISDATQVVAIYSQPTQAHPTLRNLSRRVRRPKRDRRPSPSP